MKKKITVYRNKETGEKGVQFAELNTKLEMKTLSVEADLVEILQKAPLQRVNDFVDDILDTYQQ